MSNLTIESVRSKNGFYTIEQLLEMSTNTFLDPHSTLISVQVALGSGNRFYPNVVVEADDKSLCVIGSGNTLFPGTILTASEGGQLTVRDNSQIGPGGVQIRANNHDSHIIIGDNVRIVNGAEIVGRSVIGDGAQIIGAISAQSVTLGHGGDFRTTDPDARGGVLKGFGLVRSRTVGAGEVLRGWGDFATTPIERQSAYHPRPGSKA